MVAKGEWLRCCRCQRTHAKPVTNEHDVKVAALKALSENCRYARDSYERMSINSTMRELALEDSQ